MYIRPINRQNRMSTLRIMDFSSSAENVDRNAARASGLSRRAASAPRDTDACWRGGVGASSAAKTVVSAGVLDMFLVQCVRHCSIAESRPSFIQDKTRRTLSLHARLHVQSLSAKRRGGPVDEPADRMTCRVRCRMRSCFDRAMATTAGACYWLPGQISKASSAGLETYFRCQDGETMDQCTNG